MGHTPDKVSEVNVNIEGNFGAITQLDLPNSDPITVAIVDGSGDHITSFGGGTQYTEDAAAAANPTGTVPILVRKDTPAGVASHDGDNVAQRGTNFGAAYVQVVDSSGNYVDTFGGGTQYTEDAAAAANPVGNALIMVRDDALSGQTSDDGDNVAVRGTDKGELYVKHVDAIPVTDNGGALTVDGTVAVTQSGTWDEVGIHDSGNSITVDWAGTAPPIGAGLEATALRVTLATDSTGVVSVDDNGGALTVDGTVAVSSVGGTVAVTQSGAWDEVGINDSGNKITVDWNGVDPPIGAGVEATALRVTLATDSTGVVSVDDNGGALTVDGTVGVSSVGGTVTTSDTATKVDDAGFTVAVDRVMVIGGISDNASVDSVNEDDAGAFRMSANRNLYINLRDAAGNERGANVDASNQLLVSAAQATASSLNAQVVGTVAHDSGDAGNPIKIGAKAVTLGADPTEVSSNDRTDLYATRAGQLFTLGGHPNLLTKQLNVTDGDGAQTDVNLLAAVVAATDRCVVTHITVTCDNANTGDVAVRIGFGAANTPAADAAGIILSHPGIAPGSGVSIGNGAGIIGIGADGEELRMTCEDPAGGAVDVVVGYFIIDDA